MTERLTGGDGRVEYVRAKLVLGGERGFGGCVEEEVAGTAEDASMRCHMSMSTRKGGSMYVKRPSRRHTFGLCH